MISQLPFDRVKGFLRHLSLTHPILSTIFLELLGSELKLGKSKESTKLAKISQHKSLSGAHVQREDVRWEDPRDKGK